MTDKPREEQFSSYKLLVNILEKFYNGISLSRNETFNGKQAADYLHGALPLLIQKECTRDVAVKVLKLFLQDGYFNINNNKEENIFLDNVAARYRFNDKKVENFIKDSGFSTHQKVGRTQSMRCSKSSTNRSVQKIVSVTRNDDQLCSSKRMSLSCNDLSKENEQPPEKPITASSSSYFLQSTKKNIKSLCDSVMKSSENVRNSSLVARGVSPLIQRIATRSSVRQNDASTTSASVIKKSASNTTVDSTKAAVYKSTTSAITDADEFKLWAHCLAERFRQASGGLTLTHTFSGADVRWNCRMVSARGIVARLPERVEKFDRNVDFPATFIDDLRRLANWSVTSVVRVRSPLSHAANVSSSSQRACLVPSHQLNSSRLSARNTGAATMDCSLTTLSRPLHDSPVSSRNATHADPSSLFSRIAIALVRGKFVPLVPDTVADDLVAMFEQTLHDNSTSSRMTSLNFSTMRNLVVPPNNSGRARLTTSAEAPATRLAFANQSYYTSNEDAGAQSPMRTRLQQKKLSMNEAITSNMSPQKQQKFVVCAQICLLTLEPPTRRKLQIFLLYLERILKNTEVRLHNEKSNRTYILERLSALFMEPKGRVTDIISANLLAFLLDHSQQLLFKVPQWLESDVRQKVDNIVIGKEVLTSDGTVTRRSFEAGGGVYSNHQQLRPRSSKTPPAAATSAFCDRIDSSAFDAQKHQYNDEMLKLLDGIIGNENLDPAKKAEMLRQFRITYPEVYKFRFPTNNATVQVVKETAPTVEGTQGLISRLRQMML